MKQLFRLPILGLLGILISACSITKDDTYHATITRTSYGVPHIVAEDYGSLGYGEGYSAAEDHICLIMDELVNARGEKAKYHGAGPNNAHLNQDITIKALEISQNTEEAFKNQSKEIQDWITGYTAGVNAYLNETGADKVGSWCEGAPWLIEATSVEMLTRLMSIAQTGIRLAGLITTASPPNEPNVSSRETEEENLATLTHLNDSYFGSNGWAIGRDFSENGRGLLLGNPHYPWVGPNRFWEKHLTIPGEMDVYGVNLIGNPGVAIGFNQFVGWTHTVSASKRLTFYKLDLVEGSPTTYHYDNDVREMKSKSISVTVKDEDGNLSELEHTVWFSHYGPILNMPGIGWNEKYVITYRDANAENDSMIPQWLDMGKSKGMDDLKAAHEKWNSMPWINTMATSHDGRAWYIDGSAVANLSEEAIALWEENLKTDKLTKRLFDRMGHVLLDGSDSRFEWQHHISSRYSGVNPYENKPKQERTDFIFNANDSHWLTNPAKPLEGYSPLNGGENKARSLRTRMNARMLTDHSHTGEDGKLSQVELQDAIFSNRSMAAELLLDDLVSACEGVETITIDGEKVNLENACNVLSRYDKKLNLNSRGAVLFREWITQYKGRELVRSGDLFRIPFDENDPVNTPRGLADNQLALQNLAKAILILRRADLSLDVPLGEVQIAYRGDEKIPVHGGKGRHEGIANYISFRPSGTMAPFKKPMDYIEGSNSLTEDGYLINYGSSFILSLMYTEDGPKANAILSYSQSGNPKSPHFTDQTWLFSKKQWRPILFNTEDIKQDTQSTKTLSAPRN